VPDEFSGVRGRVRNMYFYGGYYELEVQVENDLLIVKTDNRNIRQGDTVYINLRW
jgi:hypothetical protein